MKVSGSECVRYCVREWVLARENEREETEREEKKHGQDGRNINQVLFFD